MQTEPKFQITYTLTAWDYAAMARALTRRPWQRSIVTMALWLFSVWCLLVFFTGLYNPVTMVSAVTDVSSWLWILASVVVVTLLFLATHWLAWAASLPTNRIR